VRTLALDLSSVATGWAIGEPGKPEKWGTILRPKDKKGWGEAEMLDYFCEEIAWLVYTYKIEFAVGEQLNVSRNMQTTRILAGLRGAVIRELWSHWELDMVLFEPQTYRKAAKVPLEGLGSPKGKKARIMAREAKMLKTLGIEVEDDNQADACTLLVALPNLLEL